jgi:hypothetical protein
LVVWVDVNLITIQIYSVVIKTIMPNVRGCSSYLLLSVGVKDFIHYDGSGVSHEYAPCEFSYCSIMVYMSLLTMIVDPWFIIRCPLSPTTSSKGDMELSKY